MAAPNCVLPAACCVLPCKILLQHPSVTHPMDPANGTAG
jgi:hypothetical protein